MDDVARVDVEHRIQQLVHDVPLVLVLEHVAAFNHVVQVTLHVLEGEVNVHVIGRSVDAVQLDNVGMVAKGPKEHDLPEGPLCVRFIAKGIEDLLYSHRFSCALIRCSPYDTVSTAAKALQKDEGKDES